MPDVLGKPRNRHPRLPDMPGHAGRRTLCRMSQGLSSRSAARPGSSSPARRLAPACTPPGARSQIPPVDRLRAWMGVDDATFYDASKIAIVPMGFCFPGLDAKGGDLPPRKECAPQWRGQLMEHLTEVRLILLIGLYAQRWHLGPGAQEKTHGHRAQLAGIRQGIRPASARPAPPVLAQ